MPIALAISGIVMPGFALTSSSVCSARVPEPRGRPRRPLGRRRARARGARGRARPRGARRARGRARSRARARGRARTRGRRPGQPGERGGSRLELTVLLDERLELAQASGDLVTLRLEKITHR